MQLPPAGTRSEQEDLERGNTPLRIEASAEAELDRQEIGVALALRAGNESLQEINGDRRRQVGPRRRRRRHMPETVMGELVGNDERGRVIVWQALEESAAHIDRAAGSGERGVRFQPEHDGLEALIGGEFALQRRVRAPNRRARRRPSARSLF